MKRYNKNNQKGMISAFVMMAMFFFLFVILGIFSITSKRAQTQTESYELAQEKYYTENASDVYNSRIADADAIIPIYTKEQLWSIGEDVAIEIDGKIYDFSVADLSQYQLQNDIVINIDTDDLKDVKITESNGHKVYYYKDELYYQKTTSQGSLTVNGYQFQQVSINNKLGYVTDGLMLHYDGINNTGNGHSNTVTTWKDLSGHNYDGTLNGCSWEESALSFDGRDDWVNCGERNYENVTIEVVALFNQLSTSSSNIIAANWETGGYGLCWSQEKKAWMQVIINNDYGNFFSSEIAEARKLYALSGSFDGNKGILYENGRKYSTEKVGTITTTTASTVFALGVNPSGSSSSTINAFLNGKIYSVRLYNRALTDEEVKQNYEVDKARFGIN